MSLCVISRAENYMCDSWEPGDSLPTELIWEWIEEAAGEDDRCVDEDGEWLEGFPELLFESSHPIGKEADDANSEALSYCEACGDEWNEEHGSLSTWERNA